MDKLLNKVRNLTGITSLEQQGGEVFLVGGCVRDFFLQKESKDIDLIVRLLSQDEIIQILTPHGEVNTVGKSFGVIKFTPFGWTEEPIDIAQPRIDQLLDKKLGHQGIQAKFDPNISLLLDLTRRDFTINSIAVSLKGEIIDPFQGIIDIEKKIIRATSMQAFSDDPLRMLRAIQFASRFQAEIEAETWSLILKHQAEIKTISGERILEEFDKIWYKGDIGVGQKLLNQSGLAVQILDNEVLEQKPTSIGDFYWSITQSSVKFKDILKGDNDLVKDLKAIEFCQQANPTRNEQRWQIFQAIQLSGNILQASLIDPILQPTIQDFKEGKFPLSLRDLAITGNDLMAVGLVGKAIGDRKNELVQDILAEKRSNTREALLQ